MTTATKRRKTKTDGGSSTTILCADLKSALKHVKSATSPVHQGVRLSDGLITATDTETKIEWQICYDGPNVILPAARLEAILNCVPDSSEIRIVPGSTTCTIKAPHSEWTLPTRAESDFQTWEPEGTSLVCRLPSDQFKRAITSVIYAVDDKSSRYALGGVSIEVDRDKHVVWFVATDGRRASVAKAGLPHMQDPDSQQRLVPKNAAQAIADLASKEGEVTLLSNGRELVAEVDGGKVTVRLLEGRFPAWRGLFDKKTDAIVHKVAMSSLLSATTAASIVTAESSKGVTYTFSDDELTLESKSAEFGESQVKCDVEEFGGFSRVRLDPAFVKQMCDALKKLSGDNFLQVNLHGETDAVVFSYGEPDEYRCVIMPLADV